MKTVSAILGTLALVRLSVGDRLTCYFLLLDSVLSVEIKFPINLGGLVCFALCWPILLVPLTRKILDRESNALTALMLVGVIAVPLAASWYSLMGGSAGVLRILLLVFITVIVAIWSTLVMNQVAAEQAV